MIQHRHGLGGGCLGLGSGHRAPRGPVYGSRRTVRSYGRVAPLCPGEAGGRGQRERWGLWGAGSRGCRVGLNFADHRECAEMQVEGAAAFGKDGTQTKAKEKERGERQREREEAGSWRWCSGEGSL